MMFFDNFIFFPLFLESAYIFLACLFGVIERCNALLSGLIEKTTCVGCYKQLNTYYKFLITLNTQKTALPVLLYLCGNNWSLVLTTSAG